MACVKAISSRQCVRFHSATGSCSYEVCCDMGDHAFKLSRSKPGFKKRTFSSPVKRAIVSPSEFCTSGIDSLHACADSLCQLFHQCLSSDSCCTCMLTCHLLVLLHACLLLTRLLKSALDHLSMVPNYVLYTLVFSYNTSRLSSASHVHICWKSMFCSSLLSASSSYAFTCSIGWN